MRLLAIDTATDACSVAVAIGSERLVDHRLAAQQHAGLVLPMIDALLADAGLAPADLDGLVFGCGPGSFTGVRIAAAVVQGIAMGIGIGVLPVSSLAAIAEGCHREFGDTRVCPALDARRGEIYLGHYELGPHGSMHAQHDDRLAHPGALGEAMASIDGCLTLAGSGAERYADDAALSARPDVRLRHARYPHALDLLTLAEPSAKAGLWLSADQALPVYLRNRVALTQQEQRAGTRL